MKTILLVEDDPYVCELFAGILRGEGFRVLVASDGGSALALIEACSASIDLLLSDVILPKVNGGTLAVKFRTLQPASRVLLISGYEDRPPETLGFDMLKKPFAASTLLASIRNAFSESEEEPHASR